MFPSSNFLKSGLGQPPSKRPKLCIDKQSNSQGSASSAINKGDLINDLWGDDPDINVLEQVELDETFAMSQMQSSEVMTRIQSTKVSFVDAPRTNNPILPKPQLNQATRLSQLSNGYNNLSHTNNRIIGCNISKNNATTPLRRTASSGYPSINSQAYNTQSNSMNHFKDSAKELVSLQSEMKRLQIENKRLKEELSYKSGESNIVRDRLNTVQQELDRKLNKQRKELTDELKAVKQDAESIINHLSKENKSLQSQLDVNVMEKEMRLNKVPQDSPNTKSRNSKRFSFTSARSNKLIERDDSILVGRNRMVTSRSSVSIDLLNRVKELITLELLRPIQPEPTFIEAVGTAANRGLFSDNAVLQKAQNTSLSSVVTTKSIYLTPGMSAGSGDVNNSPPTSSRQTQLSACPVLDLSSLQLLSHQLLDISSDQTQHVLSQDIEVCIRILVSQQIQLESAITPQNKFMEREREVLHCSFKNLVLSSTDCNLFSSKALYNNERGISARISLALLSSFVEISDFAVELIIPRSDPDQHSVNVNTDSKLISGRDCAVPFDTHLLLYIVKDIVCQIEKQRRTLLFEGVFCGAASLIRNILQSEVTLSEKCQEIIVEILRGIVHARPGSLVMYFVLQVLIAATKYPFITNSLCHNSAKKTFMEHTTTSVITYTPGTCILQVLCVILQLVETPKKHLLTDLFTSWVLTLFNGVDQSPRWLFAAPSQMSCQCRPFISRVSFTLLGEACILYPSVPDVDCEKRLLDKLPRRGIVLVCALLFQDEYFGANIDPASGGYFEVFLHFMEDRYKKELICGATNLSDTNLNSACREILSILSLQESYRQPCSDSNGQSNEFDLLLGSMHTSHGTNKPSDILQSLDQC